jgi:Mrp family chromosome partitioning ATPase
MRTVMTLLSASADLVILDSSPLRAVSDAAILSSFVDGSMLVVDARISRRRAVRLGRAALAAAGANVLGVVLNRVPKRGTSDEGLYGVYGTSEWTAQPPSVVAETSGSSTGPRPSA